VYCMTLFDCRHAPLSIHILCPFTSANTIIARPYSEPPPLRSSAAGEVRERHFTSRRTPGRGRGQCRAVRNNPAFSAASCARRPHSTTAPVVCWQPTAATRAPPPPPLLPPAAHAAP
jgi:hypothetical protein